MQADRFKNAVESRDLAGAIDALAPNIVLHSPVTFKPFEGKEAVAKLLGVLVEVFEDFVYVDALTSDQAEILHFRARVGDKQVEGIDMLRFDEEGLIVDFTVMTRPLSATLALAERVAAGLGITAPATQG